MALPRRLRLVIFYLAGVIYRGDEPISGAPELVEGPSPEGEPMSYLAQRAVLDTRTRVRDLSGALPSVLTSALLTGFAVIVVLRWWQQDAALPASWALPSVETLFLLPGAPVVGLLALRAMVGGRNRSVASQHLMTMTARWAAVWAAVTAVWLVVTVAGIASVVYDADLEAALEADDHVPWTVGDPATSVWIRIRPDAITGRELLPA